MESAQQAYQRDLFFIWLHTFSQSPAYFRQLHKTLEFVHKYQRRPNLIHELTAILRSFPSLPDKCRRVLFASCDHGTLH